MFEYRLPAVAALAAQLKRGPIRLRLRQLSGVEFLLSVITDDRQYPIDFVCHGLTGFRATGGGESKLLDGATLREDLVILAEDLSDDAPPDATQWHEPLFTVTELATRFDVSTKTIFRWRRRGLVGWRFRMSDRRVRLAFPDRCVRRFVAQNSVLVARGANFSQLTEAERQALIERATALFNEGRRTVNAVAKVLSAETGRAVETIRLLLRQHDDQRPGAGIFNRSALEVAPDDRRLAIWEAYVDGATVAALAARFELPIPDVYSVITQMRARDLRARRIEYVDSPEFRLENADELILEDPAAAAPLAALPADTRSPADLPAYLKQLFLIPLLTPKGERALFRKMNYLKFKADEQRREIDPDTVSAKELDAIEALLDEAARVKNQIAQSNLRLVVSISKRHATPTQDFFEVVSDGNVSLLRAVDRFDYSRGFKFSTYCSWAVMKNFARTAPEQRERSDRFQTGREDFLETVPSPAMDEAEDALRPAVRNAVDRMLGALGEREQMILRQRFGLEGAGEPQTLDQIGRQFGVSKERVRQLEARAMAKLRGDFADEVRTLLGT